MPSPPAASIGSDSAELRVAVEPADAPDWLRDAVRAGGGQLVPAATAQALVWGSPRGGEDLASVLAGAPDVRWVQLPWAGIEPFVGLLDAERTWTCGKGVYAEPVAELALTLALAGLRNVGSYARSTSWTGPAGTNLLGADVTIVGGGGIATSLLRLLAPFGTRSTVVRRHADQQVSGAARVLPLDQLPEAVDGATLVVLALALTPETEGIVDRGLLGAMGAHTWLVNVARGRHVVTDDLVAALRAGAIGGAGLDVTDPEPLPAEHPLWSLPNAIVTPHVGNTPAMAVPLLSARVRENVERRIAGQQLIGLVDPAAGY